VEHFLEDGTKQPEIIERWWSLLLERLVGMLQEKQMGTRHLQCAFITDRQIQHDLTIRLCEAVADARHIGDLLRLKMERLRFDAPLLGIRMEALDTSRLEQPQQKLFAGRSRNFARQLSSLLNRLSSRLGHQAVVRFRLLPEAVPERAFEYIPVTEECFPATTKINQTLLPLDRPTCLFPQPRSVEIIAVVPNGPPSVLFVNNIRFDIVQSWGPERIEAGWWQGTCVRRDYYQVETTEGRRFWLFRRLQDQRWFLHGGIF
jgi:protein ImuB